jgi:hypothetical protein
VEVVARLLPRVEGIHGMVRVVAITHQPADEFGAVVVGLVEVDPLDPKPGHRSARVSTSTHSAKSRTSSKAAV